MTYDIDQLRDDKPMTPERLEEARRLYEAFLPSRLRQIRPVEDKDANAAADIIDRLGAALEKARADALEEAKSACLDLTGSDATPTLRPGARMCVRRIDHLARSALTASEPTP